MAAIRAAQLGLKACVVERENLGGICLNWGCIPTKAMLRSAEVFHLMHRAKDFGLSVTGAAVDLDAVVKRSRAVAKQLNGGVGHLLKKNKVEVVMGTARLTGATAVTVTTAKGEEALTARKAVILATGARARELPGLEADGDLVWTYRHALVPPRMPKNLLVIGSGAIGIEFASFYNTLGAKVTVVEVMDRILPVEDSEISAFARKLFVKQGMTILEKAGVKKLDRSPGQVVAHIEQNGTTTPHSFDTVISAVGIVGNVENLGLEALGVKVDRTHVVTMNIAARPARPFCDWRCGRGALAGPQGQPRGRDGGRTDRGRASASDQTGQHSGLHLLPPANRLGRPDRGEGARRGAQGACRPFSLCRQWQGHRAWRYRRHDQDDLRCRHGRAVGGAYGRPEVTEMIQGYVIGRQLETTEEDLMHAVFPHPTISESMHEAVLDAYGRAIHF